MFIMIDAKTVADLRQMTGAGMMDAKRALEETGGNIQKAVEELRKKGIAKAGKKADRVTKEGCVCSYIHANSKVGAMVEVQCETDFVARNEVFVELCHDLAMHITASDPVYLKREDVPQETVKKEKQMFRDEMSVQAKPAEVIEKIVEGKISKYFSEICLFEQPFIKDEDKTIEDIVKEKIVSLGENIQVTRFCRFSIGG